MKNTLAVTALVALAIVSMPVLVSGADSASDTEFAAVVIIHVDYVRRAGNSSTVIEGIDFNRAPDGSFKLHLT